MAASAAVTNFRFLIEITAVLGPCGENRYLWSSSTPPLHDVHYWYRDQDRDSYIGRVFSVFMSLIIFDRVYRKLLPLSPHP